MKRISPAWFCFLVMMAVLFLICARGAFGQCSTTNPCVPVKITGTASLTTTLLACGGTCTVAQLTAYLANPTAPSPWSLVASFPQTAAAVTYNDPRPYGTLLSYAAYQTPSGGAAGPPSPIVTFQVPAQAQAPTLIVGPNIVTTGATGLQ